MKEFERELEKLINIHCIENECDIPDFLLAELICDYIKSLKTIKKVLDWHGCDSICHPKNKEKLE